MRLLTSWSHQGLLSRHFILSHISFSASATSALVLSHNVETSPIGNHMAPQFHNCHTYVVEFSAQAPLNNETAGLQRTVYPYPCEYLSNFCVQVKTCDGDTTREKRTRHSSQKIQRFNCSTIMSVLEFHLALCH